MALKIDRRTSFDTLECDFLLAVSQSFGFSGKFSDWILSILEFARIFILLNGSPQGYFGCSRGVCQGNPL